MARSGLYKSDVKKARDALIAQGRHPSVDAVRIALGNTGSKTTIHKYLKELEDEDGGGVGRKASISETLQDLVERLAAQLQDEATARIDAAGAELAEREKRHAEALAATERNAAHWREQAQQLEAVLRDEREQHGRTREALQRETIARHTAEQQSANLETRLAENEAHRRSLEDKHRHAYEALEHYRQSVKEQREQDQRRHEQQLQLLQTELRTAQQTIVVRQEDITRVNQEGARLVAELSHVRQAWHESQEACRRQAKQLEAQQATEERHRGLQERLTAASEQASTFAGRVRELELALAQAHAKAEAQQGVVAELRAFLDARDRPATSEIR